jgi:hypothetical protein
MKKAYVFVQEKGKSSICCQYFRTKKRYPAQAYNSQGRTEEKRRLKAITEILNTYGKS